MDAYPIEMGQVIEYKAHEETEKDDELVSGNIITSLDLLAFLK